MQLQRHLRFLSRFRRPSAAVTLRHRIQSVKLNQPTRYGIMRRVAGRRYLAGFEGRNVEGGEQPKMGSKPEGRAPMEQAQHPESPPAAPRKKPARPATASAPGGSHEAILRAAAHEFAIAGYGGARADRIAAAAAVNRALPFYYFGSKARLYDEVMTRAFSRLADLSRHVLETVGHRPPQDRLRLFVRALLELSASDADWMRLIVRGIIDDQERAREFARQHLRPVVEISRRNMQRDLQSAGVTDFDPMQLIVSLACETFLYFLFAPALEELGQEPFSPAMLEAREQAIVSLLIRSIRRSAGI
jgi:AcrR family transcriptional regulator